MMRWFARLVYGLGIVSISIGVVPVLCAQSIRGTVRDSASGGPVSGAVILFMGAKDEVLARSLSDERGLFRARLRSDMQRLRVVRIGFHPRDVLLPQNDSGDVNIEIVVSQIPTLLEPVRVSSGVNCPRRDDRLAALSLLDQARAALLGTVVAVDAKPAADIVRVRFTSFLDSVSGVVDSMRVHIDSSASQQAAFQAARSAAEFVKLGFVSEEKGTSTFHAPDAETLLDDQFRDGYCFQLRAHDSARPNEVGLSFVAAKKQKARVDIDGTLWIDTVARELKDIRFDYTNLPPDLLRLHPGGSIHFRELANGVVLIDSWSLRLPSAKPETTYFHTRPSVRMTIGVQATGGAVATARWSDGFTWNAPLGEVHLHAQDDSGRAVSGREISLGGTDYHGISDQMGDVAIQRLLPGPYQAFIRDSTLAPLGISLRTSAKFSIVSNETTALKLTVPSAYKYLATECAASTGRESVANDLFLVGRIVDSLSRPVLGAEWHVFKKFPDPLGWLDLAQGVTRPDGLFQYCGGALQAQGQLKLESRRSNRDRWSVVMLNPFTTNIATLLVKLP